MKKVTINSDIPQYEDVRAWGLYQDGKLVFMHRDFGAVQTEMFNSFGDCREVTIVADKTTVTTIYSDMGLIKESDDQAS